MSYSPLPLDSGSDGLTEYLYLLRRVPLLTASEELHLAAIVQQWLKDPQPTKALRCSAERARNRMVSANLRLVVMIARRYSSRLDGLHLEMLDLLQAGNLGLIEAVERFDPKRGYKFSTYAFWWIRKAIGNCLRESGSPIRIPVPMITLVSRAHRLQARSDRSLTTRELAAALDVEEERLEASLRAVRHSRMTSLHQPIAGATDDLCLIDAIADERAPVMEEDYRWLREQVDALDHRERRLLSLRYAEPDGRSLSSTAEMMGLTKGVVQNLERQTFRKLRRCLAPVLDPCTA